ncbi:trigger factor [Sphingomonas sp. S17]|uniref:Trigger factor n=2 Tax=Sphingomonas paucimobilis TaxID=13689 RepID=A0A411LML3_SPHPI|nr:MULTISPECIES: trigger factor [Sphingomonas]EGI55230.1 trigger factor [Sphingomonas sp. S17]MBQ1478454.1 trigger factor [Sphingomonas sp.]MCM3679700.1 trigger factor [Sphingomonas paucimobilis]MDG5970906.1 trigger factor [Sphingomonas paucimobilis]NNG58394.1 trigger factor [Sphingomonas paucimobilis]
MQTVETLNEGLKRAYTLTITAQDIEGKVDAELKRIAPQMKMPGFRPGKVPANLVRKMHGPALLQDALNTALQEGVQTLIAEQGLRPAMQPQVELAEGYEQGQDAKLTVTLEVLPQVPTPAIDALKLERLTVPVADEAVDEQLQKFADQQKRWDDAGDKAAEQGDQVTVDFVGKTLDGVAFEGGSGEDMAVEIGGGRLIPGFEDQLVGVKAGEEKQISVTFPEDYPAKELAGQPATFDLTIKSVKTAGEAKVDDEMAKNLGLESLEQLRGLLKGQIEQEHNGLTRTYMKRKLLDQLADGHDFEVPPSMVEAEFSQIWAQLEHEATHEEDPEAAKAEMEKERDDYRKIAERRVRLGLLLSEIGQANGVDVTAQEMNRLIAQAAQQYGPEDRQRFIQYIQQEPMAAAQLRAPLYEDKVVDFLFDKAEITDRETTREELEAAIESEDGFATGTHVHNHDHDHDHDHGAKKPAKAKAKKAVTEEAASEDAAAEEAPKKATRAKKAAPAEGEADAAEATEEAPAKKPRAKKTAAPAEGEAEAAEAPAKKPRAKKAAPTE